MSKDVIIQARMGSTRLPGKVLKKIKGKPVLWHVVKRVEQSKLIDNVIIATTTSENDDKIVEFCQAYNIKYYRGSEENVLKRYYETAKYFNTDIILRITSDCPLIDPQIIDELLRFYIKNDYDLVTNAGSDLSQRTYPRGFDTEIFSYQLISTIFKKANEKYQLEHVTPYIYENNYKIFYYKNTKDYSKYRLTLDTKQDYELISNIYEALYNGKHDFYLEAITHFLKQNESLIEINKNNVQKGIINLRKVNGNDINLLYEWANDALVRKNSFNSNEIPLETHKKWFANSIESDNRELFIGEINKQPIGQIRIDIEKNFAKIGYSIAKKYRGNGYGKYLIQELILFIRNNESLNKRINFLIGDVKKSNIASCKIFETLGFTKKEIDGKNRYEKEIN